MSRLTFHVIDNEDLMILWVGSSVSPQVLKDLLDVDDIMHVDPRMVSFQMTVLPVED